MKRPEKKHTYAAFYSDSTVKVGFCADVMKRMRTLGGSSSCFVCFRATHENEQSARKAEAELKKQMISYLIKDAECREWLNPKKRGFFPALKKSLESLKLKVFDYAFALGQKSDTDWEPTTPKKVKKIVTGKP